MKRTCGRTPSPPQRQAACYLPTHTCSRQIRSTSIRCEAYFSTNHLLTLPSKFCISLICLQTLALAAWERKRNRGVILIDRVVVKGGRMPVFSLRHRMAMRGGRSVIYIFQTNLYRWMPCNPNLLSECSPSMQVKELAGLTCRL